MSSITVQQAVQYAQQAGFSGASLVNVVAIAMAESNLDPAIRGHADPRDRGVLQINSYWHPEVSDQCAFDPACAFRAGYSISQGGKDFHEWCTYNLGCANPPNANGPYKNFIGQVQAAITGTPMPISNTPSTVPVFGPALDQFKIWGEYAGVFILALIFVLMGFYLLNQQAVNHAVGSAVKVAAL